MPQATPAIVDRAAQNLAASAAAGGDVSNRQTEQDRAGEGEAATTRADVGDANDARVLEGSSTNRRENEGQTASSSDWSTEVNGVEKLSQSRSQEKAVEGQAKCFARVPQSALSVPVKDGQQEPYYGMKEKARQVPLQLPQGSNPEKLPRDLSPRYLWPLVAVGFLTGLIFAAYLPLLQNTTRGTGTSHSDSDVAADISMTLARPLQGGAGSPPSPAGLAMNHNRPKLAFLFLIKKDLVHAALWARFFKGYEGQYSIYIQATQKVSPTVIWSLPAIFQDKFLPLFKAGWGRMEIVHAEKVLVAHALQDKQNTHFLLLSETCIPLWPFWFVRNYVSQSPVSFIESYSDFRQKAFKNRYVADVYRDVIPKDMFRKGSQWFVLRRQHAEMFAKDKRYFTLFVKGCKAIYQRYRGGLCCADEHFLQTLLYMKDPGGISYYPLTFVDWRVRGYHPRSFTNSSMSAELITAIKREKHFVVYRKYFTRTKNSYPHFFDPSVPEPAFTAENGYCAINGKLKPCFLFARKFTRNTLPFLLNNSKALLGF